MQLHAFICRQFAPNNALKGKLALRFWHSQEELYFPQPLGQMIGNCVDVIALMSLHGGLSSRKTSQDEVDS